MIMNHVSGVLKRLRRRFNDSLVIHTSPYSRFSPHKMHPELCPWIASESPTLNTTNILVISRSIIIRVRAEPKFGTLLSSLLNSQSNLENSIWYALDAVIKGGLPEKFCTLGRKNEIRRAGDPQISIFDTDCFVNFTRHIRNEHEQSASQWQRSCAWWCRRFEPIEEGDRGKAILNSGLYCSDCIFQRG